MTFVIGRGESDSRDLSEGDEGLEMVDTEASAKNHEKPTGRLGRYRALDGSDGAALYLDLDHPHAILVVGKRGYGKSFTLGVIAEELARTDGVAPVVVDPMGVFTTLAQDAVGDSVPAAIIDHPTIEPNSLDPQSWCSLLDLSPESGAGSLVWRAAREESTLCDMKTYVRETDAPGDDRRAAVNHLVLAEGWDIFDPGGLDAQALAGNEVTVLDVSGLDSAPMNAVCRGVCETLYHARIRRQIRHLPWVLVDEAHTFFEGLADAALKLVLTRGRAPGVSLVTATQRPSALPAVAISQSDVLLSHRLTSQDDLQALVHAQPTYLDASLEDRMPTEPGEVTIVDDSTETVHAARIRPRDTPHGGDSPGVSEIITSSGAHNYQGQ